VRVASQSLTVSPKQHHLREFFLESSLALVDAVAKMSALGARQMALVEGGPDSKRLVGVLAMSDVMRAHSKAAEGYSWGAIAGESSSVRRAVNWRGRDAPARFTSLPTEPPEGPE
jgi:hypothetical protein